MCGIPLYIPVWNEDQFILNHYNFIFKQITFVYISIFVAYFGMRYFLMHFWLKYMLALQIRTLFSVFLCWLMFLAWLVSIITLCGILVCFPDMKPRVLFLTQLTQRSAFVKLCHLNNKVSLVSKVNFYSDPKNMAVIWICFVVLFDEPLYVVVSMPFVLCIETV